ncbi:LysR substrate-binding domain-containing protein [Nocardia sp. NPDC020380]|uniref:LysR substrate-binding domain-containing protein n=1 Tax=Nocardia sp. NPDC020380 TaxID=3364309 RepID=UPI0037A87C75
MCTSIGIYFTETTPLPLLGMCMRGIRFHTGRAHARPAMEPILDLVRTGRLHPEQAYGAATLAQHRQLGSGCGSCHESILGAFPMINNAKMGHDTFQLMESGRRRRGESRPEPARVDLEIGVIDHADPETIVEPLAEVAMLGIAAAGHPFTTGPVAPEIYAAAEHLSVSRRGRLRGPIDKRLAELGLSRRVVATVPNYAEALIAVRDSELICHTPGFPDTSISAGTGIFRIPLDLPSAEVAMAWHPRHHADSAHSWLRARVRATVEAALTG